MIVEIHKASSSTAGPLRYNWDKVRAGVASVICEHGIGSTDPEAVSRVFADRERMSLREAQHVAFQMSVNPGPCDRIREEDIPDFVHDLMEGMGYGEQPWVLFLHEDIERVHYHVVSTRIGGDGRKIRDFYEKRQCDRLVLSLEGRYGYVKGKDPAAETPGRDPLPVFRPGCADVVRNIEGCVSRALGYRFTTERQFSEILRCHGVKVQEGLGRHGLGAYLSFQGLGTDGRPCTASVSGERLSFDVRASLEERVNACRASDLSAEKAAARSGIMEALENAEDMGAFMDRLKCRHLDIVIYSDRDGVVRGTTIIDHRSRCAFKGSDISRTLIPSLLELTSDGGTSATGLPPENHLETQETRSVNSGISDALSAILDVMMPAGSGRKGKDLEDPMKRRKKKRKRRGL